MKVKKNQPALGKWPFLANKYTYRQNYAIQMIHSEQVLKLSHLGTQKKKIQTTATYK